MKTRAQNFVIEYKGGRRQQKSTASSIWGNTDFKALTRAVSEDHDFGRIPKPRHATVVVEGADDFEEIQQVEPLTLDRALPPNQAAPIEDAEIDAQDHADGISSDVSGLHHSTIAPRKPLLIEKTDKPSPMPLPLPVDRLAQLDEFSALEAENLALRWLWLQKLRFENQRLNSMLRRFKL